MSSNGCNIPIWEKSNNLSLCVSIEHVSSNMWRFIASCYITFIYNLSFVFVPNITPIFQAHSAYVSVHDLDLRNTTPDFTLQVCVNGSTQIAETTLHAHRIWISHELQEWLSKIWTFSNAFSDQEKSDGPKLGWHCKSYINISIYI